MTNFYVTYKFADRKTRDEFYNAVKENGAAEKSREEDGCIRYEYFYYADADNKIFLWEQWTSREAQKKHCQQPHFRELTEIKEKYGAETDIRIEDQYCR